MSFFIIQPGEKLPSLARIQGDFADWVTAGMGLAATDATIIYPHRGDSFPDPHGAVAVVITGSSVMVTDDAPWIRQGAAWLGNIVATGVPVLGICFGHQWLGQALGGRVAANPRGTEVGSVEVRLSPMAEGDPLLGGLPSRMALPVSHRQSVLTLPPGAIHLASSDLEANQAFRFGDRAWGVQFHPEFSADIARGYLDYHAATVSAAGRDPGQLKNAIKENETGARILQRFAEFAGIAGA